jgi:SRSO17 transposase
MSLAAQAPRPLDYVEALHGHIAHRFARAEPRERALVYLRGILDPVGRRNGWQLAAQGGEKYPDGMQRLLSTAHWSADGVRDDIRDFVLGYAGDRNAVLVVDEWRFPKKGHRSVGVHNARSSKSRRTENVQTGLFCTYVSPRGNFLVDRELFLPNSWLTDRGLRRAARIPEELPYRTVPELAGAMVARAITAQVPARWVAAGAVVTDQRLRRFLEKSRMWFVLGMAAGDRLPVVVGDRRSRHSAAALAAMLATDLWVTQPGAARALHSYEWARVRLPVGRPGSPPRWLLLRRDTGTGEHLRAYLCQSGPATTLPELVDVALLLERNRYVLAAACAGAGLDEYEVRRWTGWYRYTTLALAAHNCLELAGRRTETTDQVSIIPTARTPHQRLRPPRAVDRRPTDTEEETCPSPDRPSRQSVPCASRCGSTSSSATCMVPRRRGRSPFPVSQNGRRPGWAR